MRDRGWGTLVMGGCEGGWQGIPLAYRVAVSICVFYETALWVPLSISVRILFHCIIHVLLKSCVHCHSPLLALSYSSFCYIKVAVRIRCQ